MNINMRIRRYHQQKPKAAAEDAGAVPSWKELTGMTTAELYEVALAAGMGFPGDMDRMAIASAIHKQRG